MSNLNILFIGGGNMAKAMIAGLIAAKFSPENIIVIDRNLEKRLALKQNYGVQVEENWDNITSAIDIIVLAIKPQKAEETCRLLNHFINNRSILIISVMTGVTTSTLEHWLGQQLAIIRSMPNTPAFIRAGATGLFANQNASLQDKQSSATLMSTIGEIVWVEHESDIDVITALSGSGPAYFFYFMECMETTGIEMGLTPEVAKNLTLQTAYGAAKLAVESGMDVKTLRANVTAKGGTTEAALKVMQDNKLFDIIMNAMRAAQQKAIELSKLFEWKK